MDWKPLGIALLTGCTVSNHEVVPASLPAPAPVTAHALRAPGPIEHPGLQSASWQVPLSGLLDLNHPEAASAFHDGDTPIVLPIHVLRHPVHGTAVVDTGVPQAAFDDALPVPWYLGPFVETLTPERSLASVRDTYGLDAVLVTHFHLDHVLGLPDVPHDVPVYVGEAELEEASVQNALLRPTMAGLLADRPPLHGWPFEEEGQVLPGGLRGVDLWGDGSLWAVDAPGHTAGSTAYLARTPQGAVLFAGDVSHLHWGWDHGVTPGTFTADHERHRETLAQLIALADAVDAQVFMGHELDGETTGPVVAGLSR